MKGLLAPRPKRMLGVAFMPKAKEEVAMPPRHLSRHFPFVFENPDLARLRFFVNR